MRIILLLLAICFYCVAFTQPSDAKVKSDAIGNGGGVLSFKFTKSTGTRQWNSSAGNWEYVRGVEIKRKSDYPGINMIVNEDVVYQYIGNGGYSFWKVRVLSNRYEGIPNPTAKEINDFISMDWQKFYGYYFNTIVKLWHQPVLAENPQWVWHDINSVEFRMKMKFDHIIRAKGIETLECIWNVRLYRDNPKGPWKNLLALRSEEAADLKVVEMKNYTVLQMEDFDKQTLAFTMAEHAGSQKNIEYSKVLFVPAFSNADEMIRFVYNILRKGTVEQFKALMLQVLAPGFFVEGSRYQLLPHEERNLNEVITAAYKNKVKFHQLYCAEPYYTVERWGNSETRKDIKIKSAVENCNTLFTVDRVNTGYIEGKPITRLVILSYGIYVRQDQDVMNYINSFSEPQKICDSN